MGYFGFGMPGGLFGPPFMGNSNPYQQHHPIQYYDGFSPYTEDNQRDGKTFLKWACIAILGITLGLAAKNGLSGAFKSAMKESGAKKSGDQLVLSGSKKAKSQIAKLGEQLDTGYFTRLRELSDAYEKTGSFAAREMLEQHLLTPNVGKLSKKKSAGIAPRLDMLNAQSALSPNVEAYRDALRTYQARAHITQSGADLRRVADEKLVALRHHPSTRQQHWDWYYTNKSKSKKLPVLSRLSYQERLQKATSVAELEAIRDEMVSWHNSAIDMHRAVLSEPEGNKFKDLDIGMCKDDALFEGYLKFFDKEQREKLRHGTNKANENIHKEAIARLEQLRTSIHTTMTDLITRQRQMGHPNQNFMTDMNTALSKYGY